MTLVMDADWGRWGDGELTGPHSPKGVGIRGNGVVGSVRGVRSKQLTTNP
ncbi:MULTISPECIES: hypothetical protein [Fischerella]|nr:MULTISPECIES: hypothetical protein [Fischerella]